MPEPETQSTYVFGAFRLLPEQRQVQGADGQNIVLRGKVFDLLWYLIRQKGRLIGKNELMEALWPDAVVEENNLNQAVSALRQALGDDAKTPQYIATVKGRGYQFVGDVRPESASGVKRTDVADTAASNVVRYRLLLLLAAAIAIAMLLWISREVEHPLPATPIVQRFAEATLSIVTDFPGSHSAPTLSPDGRMIAYVSNASGTSQIWVKNLQRGDPIRITDGPLPAGSPTWAPDDSQILFHRSGPEGYSIYSVGTLGSPTATKIVKSGSAPKFAKRVNKFVFSRWREIWIAKNEGRDSERVVGIPVSQGFAARDPALSPDGKFIAFIHADEGPLGNLWLIPSKGGEARQLTTLEMSGGIASAPEWSDDGRFIVFSVDAESSGGQLWRFEVDSGEATALTTGAGGANQAAISHDDRRLAYTATRTMWRLTRLDPLTEETSTIYASRAPVLLPIASPDGKRIVYFTLNSSGMNILTIDSDGNNLRQLTFDEAGENTLPTWSGDGTAILYYRGRSLHRLSPTDGSDEEVFANFHWSSRNWLTAYGDRISYHIIDRPTGEQRTVVRQLGESSEIELPVPIEGAQWSNDGIALLGWFRKTNELLICNPDAATCRNIENEGKSVLGVRPKWSNDGQQIYYLDLINDAECCELWRVDVDGTDRKQIAELAGFDLKNSYYGIDADGDIFYSHLDRSTAEIWLAVIDE